MAKIDFKKNNNKKTKNKSTSFYFQCFCFQDMEGSGTGDVFMGAGARGTQVGAKALEMYS